MALSIKTIGNLTESLAKFAKLEKKSSVLFTKSIFEKINVSKLKNVPLKKDVVNFSEDIAYHGSPYSFDFFDAAKVGSGEGFGKRGKGIYLHRKIDYAPYFANIKSEDAPLHLGCGEKLKNPNPHIYKISGLKQLNLKKVSDIDAKGIARTQKEFESQNPFLDGIELESGEICIFPRAINKLNIKNKQPLESFIREHKDYPFRAWTTDKEKLAKLTT